MTESELTPWGDFTYGREVDELFRKHRLTLLVTAYQAQQIFLIFPQETHLSFLSQRFERPTGLAIHGEEMALVTLSQIWFFRAAYGSRKKDGERASEDLIFAPHKAHVTGDLLGHECGWFGGQFVFVNTRFSCLATVDDYWSFVPVWVPRFLTGKIGNDCCHLNGLCGDSHGVRYVTVLAETGGAEEWRNHRCNGGAVIDVRSHEAVTRGMAMAHSPRLYRDALWVLESGVGELQQVDIPTGRRTTVTVLPGYPRGLAFFEDFAFIGLSKIREKYYFGGLPIEERCRELICGIAIVNLRTGNILGTISFTSGTEAGIEEIFDIQIIKGPRRPMVAGLDGERIKTLTRVQPDFLSRIV